MKTESILNLRSMRIAIAMITLALFGASHAIGQVQFQKTYKAQDAISSGYCVQQTGDDGYIIAGRADDASAATRDALLVKTSATGVIQWTFDYSRLTTGAFIDEARYVIEVDDMPMDGRPDGYVFVGWSVDFNGDLSDKDILAVRVDLNGGLVWQTLIGDPNNDYDEQAFAVRQDPNDGHCVLTGGAEVSLTGAAVESRLLTMKIDVLSGAVIWDNVYGIPGATYEGTETQGYSLDLWDSDLDGTDDGWVVTGWVTDNTNPLGVLYGEDIYLIGMDFNGTPLGLYKIGVAASPSPSDFSTEYGLSVIQRTNGEILIAGEYIPPINDPVGGPHPTLLTVPGDFHRSTLTNWMRYYIGNSIQLEAAYSVREDPNQLVVASGGAVGQMYQIDNDPTPNYGSVVMFNTNGLGSVVNWGWNYIQSLSMPGNNGNAYSIRVTSDAYVMTGMEGTLTPGDAVHLVKTNFVGSARCDEIPLDIDVETVEPYRLSHGVRIDVDLDNISTTMDNVEDLTEYVHCLSPKRVQFINPSTGSETGPALGSVESYPNPVRSGGELLFRLNLENAAIGTVTVSDMQGRVVYSESSEYSAGPVDVPLNTANWPAGAYTMVVEAGTALYRDRVVVLD